MQSCPFPWTGDTFEVLQENRGGKVPEITAEAVPREPGVGGCGGVSGGVWLEGRQLVVRGGDQPGMTEGEKKGDCRGLAGSQPWKTLNARVKALDEMEAEHRQWQEVPAPPARASQNRKQREWETIQTPALLLTHSGMLLSLGMP